MAVHLRASKISIDIPTKDAEPWVFAVVQRVEVDEEGNAIHTNDRVENVYRRFSKVYGEMETIFDPIQQKEVTISGAGMALFIGRFVDDWIKEDMGGEFDEDGNLVVGNS